MCHLFRDVLHGWGRILLSVNVSPCSVDYDENSHVLKVLYTILHTHCCCSWLLSAAIPWS